MSIFGEPKDLWTAVRDVHAHTGVADTPVNDIVRILHHNQCVTRKPYVGFSEDSGYGHVTTNRELVYIFQTTKVRRFDVSLKRLHACSKWIASLMVTEHFQGTV